MKAVICRKYGSPEVLELVEMPKPSPKKNEILVKVIAAPVNTADTRIRGLAVEGAMKLVMRLVLGFSKPRNPIMGIIFSGVVEQVGEKVTKFKVGDEVFGTTGLKMGTNAEYLTIAEDGIVALKPRNATHEVAGAIPFGGQTAIYFLEKAKLNNTPNQKILIYGATGSVGAAAIQLAQHYQAEVTAVCSSKGQAMVERLGVHRILLYDQEDFTKTTERFDVVFDAVGKVTKKECKHLLRKGGRFLTVGGLDVAAERTEQLELLCQLYEQGKYDATIDKVFPMQEVVKAHQYVDTGRKKGNVVLRVAQI